MKTIMSLAIVILLVAVSAAGATEKRIMQISKDGTTVTFEDGACTKSTYLPRREPLGGLWATQ